MVRAIVAGAAGRMGRAVIAAAHAQEGLARQGLVVSAALEHAASAALGADSGELAGIGRNGIAVGANLDAALATGDVLIDFTDAATTLAHLEACARARVAALICTTGLAADVYRRADELAREIPVLIAANTSLGVTLLAELVRQAARVLPTEFDIEVIEAHHRHKKDAPSGTALALGRAAADGRGQALEQTARWARHGVSPRAEGEIGFAVVRGGDIVGDHSVLFAGPAERLVLSHQATDRAIFARGAVAAAAWLASQAPGRYEMRDFILNKTMA
ncbi:MAG: 4-hydroxy-tetrahydrodipicolinate reductase [Steroidobacteraceae bacterium]